MNGGFGGAVQHQERCRGAAGAPPHDFGFLPVFVRARIAVSFNQGAAVYTNSGAVGRAIVAATKVRPQVAPAGRGLCFAELAFPWPEPRRGTRCGSRQVSICFRPREAGSEHRPLSECSNAVLRRVCAADQGTGFSIQKNSWHRKSIGPVARFLKSYQPALRATHCQRKASGKKAVLFRKRNTTVRLKSEQIQ